MGPEVPNEVYLPVRGYSQVSLLAISLTEGKETLQKELYQGYTEACIAWLMPTPNKTGTLSQTHWNLVEERQTFLRLSKVPELGIRIDPKNRVTTGSYGMVFLGAKDRKKVEKDLEVLEELDSQGNFFTVEESNG